MLASVPHCLAHLRNGDSFGLGGKHVCEQIGSSIDDLWGKVDAVFDEHFASPYEFTQLGSIDAVGDSVATLFVWLRFPVLGLVMIIALGVLYHAGPDRKTRYRPLTVGAAVAMGLWIGLSALFTIYTSTVASYNETYGSIGGIVVLLLWLFITAFVVLLGAEIHAQRENQAAE